MSILGVGKGAMTGALSGMQRSAKLEQQRKGFNDDVGRQNTQRDIGTATGAVTMGAAIGTMIMPGVGTAVGAGIGAVGAGLYYALKDVF